MHWRISCSTFWYSCCSSQWQRLITSSVIMIQLLVTEIDLKTKDMKICCAVSDHVSAGLYVVFLTLLKILTDNCTFTDIAFRLPCLKGGATCYDAKLRNNTQILSNLKKQHIHTIYIRNRLLHFQKTHIGQTLYKKLHLLKVRGQRWGKASCDRHKK